MIYCSCGGRSSALGVNLFYSFINILAIEEMNLNEPWEATVFGNL